MVGLVIREVVATINRIYAHVIHLAEGTGDARDNA
jgi:hypothetical protein